VTLFWIIAAALILSASLLLAWPLWRGQTLPAKREVASDLRLAVYRDQLAELDAERLAARLAPEQYAQARDELENRLNEELPPTVTETTLPRKQRLLAVSVALAVALLSVLLYLVLGNPNAVLPPPADAAHGLGEQQMDSMIVRLTARLEKNQQDAKGWAMLARAQAVLGRFEEANVTYDKAVALFPDDAQLLADYADAKAMAQGGHLAGEPEQLVARALRADPLNAKALALAGTIAFDNKDFALALKHWELLRSTIAADSEFTQSIQASIDEAKSLSLVSADKRKNRSITSNGK